MLKNTSQVKGMRMGSITVLVYVVLLCVAVMAVLCVSVARMNTAYTDRQGSFVEDTYRNESAAQELLSVVDFQLSENGVDGLRAQLNQTARDIQENNDVSLTVKIDDDDVLNATFESQSGRQLVVRIALSDYGYDVLQWKTDVEWKQDDSVRLWQG